MNQKALEAGARKLSRRNCSVKELMSYLLGKGFSEEEVSAVIEELKDYGYLNDVRFTEDYIRYGLSKNWSLKRIRTELKTKGVSADDMEQGFDAYVEEFGEPDEQEQAVNEALKVLRALDFGAKDVMTDKIKGRIARRLAARGFSAAMIFDAIARAKRMIEDNDN